MSRAFSQNTQDWRWQVQSNSPPVDHIFNDIQFVNASTAYTVGYYPQCRKTTDGGRTWRNQTLPQSDYFYAVCFVGPSVGTVVGDNGAIARTTDGGITWVLQQNSAYAHFRGVSFTDSSKGTIVGLGGSIVTTTDGGIHWTNRASGVSSALNSVSSAGTIRVAVGAFGTIVRSTSSGAGWSTQSSGTTQSLRDVSLFNDRLGIAVGDGGVALRTTDGGATWVNISTGTTESLRGISIVDSLRWYIGSNGSILHTVNGGNSWITQTLSVAAPVLATSFINDSTGMSIQLHDVFKISDGGTVWERLAGPRSDVYRGVSAQDSLHAIVVGKYGVIQQTTDAGESWNGQPSGTGADLYGVRFVNSLTGIALGDSGVILRTTDGGTTWNRRTNGPGGRLRGVDFVDVNHGIAVGYSDSVLWTTDGGMTWLLRRSGFHFDWLGASYLDITSAVLVGDSGAIVKTTNSGITWYRSFTDTVTTSLTAVSFSDPIHGTAVGSKYYPPSSEKNSIILRSNDGGESWTTFGPYRFWPLTAVAQPHERIAVTSGETASINGTIDAGQSWVQQTAGYFHLSTIYGISFADTNNGFAVGDDATIMHTVTGGELPGRPAIVDTVQGTDLPTTLLFRWRPARRAAAYRVSVFMVNIPDAFFSSYVTTDTFATMSGLPSSVRLDWSIYGLGADTNVTGESSSGTCNTGTNGLYLFSPPRYALDQALTDTLRWLRNLSATSYDLQVATTEDFSGSLIVDVTHYTDTLRVLTGLKHNTTYYWRVKFKTPFGDGGFTASSFMTRDYDHASISQLQSVIHDSLTVADGLQNTNPLRWTLQSSPFIDDTVITMGICVIPPGILTAPELGGTAIFYDSSTTHNAWRGIQVRTGPSGPVGDFGALKAGSLALLNGVIREIPSTSLNSTTILELISCTIIDSLSVPPTFGMTVENFYRGGYPGGTVRYSDGEQYEDMYIQFRSLTVSSYVSTASGTFTMTDANGNTITMYDGSKWFTLRTHRGASSSYSIPPIGSHIISIRGVILTVGGSENNRGYVITPINEGDIVYGAATGGSIAGSLFEDTNGDSTREAGEPDISGWRVDVSGGINASFLSGGDGSYSIPDLDSGTYMIHAAPRAGWNFTHCPGGAYTVRLATDETSSANDFGFYYAGSTVDGVIFDDRNENGVQDAYENGQSGWLVVLAGALQDSISTDSHGRFLFRRLPGGNYSLSVRMISGWEQSSPDGMYSLKISSDGDEVSGKNFAVHKARGRIKLTMNVKDNTAFAQRDIWWGVRAGATFGIFGADPRASGYDSVEGEYELPPQLYGVFDARFEDPRSYDSRFDYGSWTDMRDYVSPTQTDTYQVSFRPGYFYGGDYPFTIRWSRELVAQSYGGPVTLTDPNGNTTDMKEIDGRIISDIRVHTLTLVAQRPILPLSSQRIWRLVSVPTRVNDPRVGTLFPSAASPAFSYTPGVSYRIEDTLVPGRGYWLKHVEDLDYFDAEGEDRFRDTLELTEGWNLVGSLSVPMDIRSPETIPPGIIESAVFGFKGGYVIVDSLLPREGYWIRARSGGKLILDGSTPVSHMARPVAMTEPGSKLSRIVVTDAAGNEASLSFGSKDQSSEQELSSYELPPPPPFGIFDVRFGSGLATEVVGRGDHHEISILVTSAVYPLTLRWELDSQAPASSLLIDRKETVLQSDGSLKLSNEPSSLKLSLTWRPDVPLEFRLEQNFPNPFNPSTTIRYELPEPSQVKLIVYNVLGEELATLADEVMPAGYRATLWNGRLKDERPVASGVYFCRLDASSVQHPKRRFTSVKRMVLIR